MTTETIYSIDDLFDGIEVEFAEDDLEELDYPVCREEDEMIYEMLAGYEDDSDFLSEICKELYGE